MHHQNDAERRFSIMTEALTFRAESDFIDAIRLYSEKAGLSVNAALKEIIAPVIGFSRRRSNNPAHQISSLTL